MCGIAGFAGFQDRRLLQKMVASLEHRGPDEKGFFFDGNVSLGSARLSIIDLKSGRQPIYNESRDIAVVFNGEIYNYQALHRELENKGHRFYTNTDTETIVHCYEEHGTDLLKKLNGMFAFALWDSRKKALVLGRDRIGIKPLYYAAGNGKIVFASELKALLQFRELSSAINFAALSHFLAMRVTPNDESMVAGISKLPPAHCLVFRNGKISVSRYWNAGCKEEPGSLGYYAGKFREILEKSVQSHLQSDVPLGVFLSGGLDSSAITALASKQGSLNTFTAGFGLPSDEFSFAKRVAEQFSTTHNEVVVELDSMARAFPELLYHLDEPCADPAIFATFFVSRFARKKVKVALLGEGSDELFAGYSHHRIGSGYFSFVPAYFKRKAYEYFLQRQAFSAKEVGRLLAKNSIAAGKFYALPGGKNFLDRMLLKELTEILPGMQLQRVDRMAMANSLEARVPFLGNQMIDFALKVPPWLKLKGFTGKFVARKAMHELLPKKLLREGKRAFFTPLAELMQHGLLALAENSLLSKESLFERKPAAKLVEKFKRNRKDEFLARKLWMLLMAGQWHERMGLPAP